MLHQNIPISPSRSLVCFPNPSLPYMLVLRCRFLEFMRCGGEMQMERYLCPCSFSYGCISFVK